MLNAEGWLRIRNDDDAHPAPAPDLAISKTAAWNVVAQVKEGQNKGGQDGGGDVEEGTNA